MLRWTRIFTLLLLLLLLGRPAGLPAVSKPANQSTLPRLVVFEPFLDPE